MMEFDSLTPDEPGPQPGPAPEIVKPPEPSAPIQFDSLVPDAPTEAGKSFDSLVDDDEKYRGPGQQLKAGLEGAAKGFAGPLATLAETQLLDIDPKDIQGRERVYPWTHGLSEAGGFGAGLISGVGEGAAIDAAGNMVSRGVMGAMTQGVAESGAQYVGARLAAGAAKAAAEMSLFQAGDEGSKAILGDPNQSMGSIATNIGLSGLLGGVTGPLFTGTGLAIKAGLDNTNLKDFVDRLAFRKSNIDPNEMIKSEAENVINTYRSMNDELTGPTGLKAQAINKLLPETMNSNIYGQIKKVLQYYGVAVAEMNKKNVPDRLINKFKEDSYNLMNKIIDPEVTVSDAFEAINQYKADLQAYSKGNFGPFAVKKYNEAYDLINITKNMSREVRLGLEDSSVWGKAADIQKELNGAWTKVLPAVKKFEGQFMKDLGTGIKEISSDKFNTYTGQVGKSVSTTDRQHMMGNFIHEMSNFFDKTEKIYSSAGVENPFPPVGMQMLKESINTPSAGSKLADLWYNKLEASTLGSVIGSSLGAAAGHTVGQGIIGALVGKEVLGPVFSAFIKPILDRYPNVDLNAFRKALSIGKNIQEGNRNLNSSLKNLFIAGAKTVPSHLMPDKKTISQLNDQIQSFNQNPEKMAELAGNSGYYAVGHDVALGKTAFSAVQYLNNLRPQMKKGLILDPGIKPTAEEEYKFYRALEVAEQPLLVIDKIKKGTILPQDVDAVRSIYPEFYQKVSQDLMGEVVAQVNEGKSIPYKLKQGLSLFLGTPLDSTMTPESIQSIQSVFMATQKSNIPQAPQGNKKSTSSLSKASSRYLTSDQAAQERQTRPT